MTSIYDASRTGVAWRQFRVLAVDNKARILSTVADVCRNLPYEIQLVAVKSADEAREAIDVGFFHLALVDLHLEDGVNRKSGKDVLQYLVEKAPRCERIVITR